MNEDDAPIPDSLDVFTDAAMPTPASNERWDGPNRLLGDPGSDSHEAGLLIRQVQGRFNYVQDQQLRTNKALYGLLGLIYQAESNIGGDPLKVAFLRGYFPHGLNDEQRKQWKQWERKGRSLAEQLIAMLLTLTPERKVTRHQWNAAIKAAVKAEVPPTEQDFVNWIEGVGGIIAANAFVEEPKEDDVPGNDNDDDDDVDVDVDGPVQRPTRLNLLRKLADERDGDAEEIEVTVDPHQDLYRGFCLLLAHNQWSTGTLGKHGFKILAKIHDPVILKEAAKMAMAEAVDPDVTKDSAGVSESANG